MLLSRAHDLSPSSSLFLNPFQNLPLNPNSMRKTLFHSSSLLRSLTPHHQNHCRHYYKFIQSVSSYSTSLSRILPLPKLCYNRISNFSCLAASSISAEQVVGVDENWDFQSEGEGEAFKFDDFSSVESKHLSTPVLEVKELEELPEQWRRSKLAWLCKELPAHKSGTMVRILNAQRKWMTQEDITYVAVHCLRIRENETGFKVYKWMRQQSKFTYDFSLATKLANYMGKERKFTKCRDIFDDIINQGRVPSESTFHILIIAYLSASVQGCLEEACSIYNRMIQLGGYRPSLSLHNSLFRALVSEPGGSSKYYLKQAEFIFHNLVTSGLDIHKDIMGGLIWLHSHQDTIDKDRIVLLRNEMRQMGFEESKEVLVSVLRAYAKEGDIEEVEKTWIKLLNYDRIPSQAFVYKMEVYATNGDYLKSLEIFRDMQKIVGSTSVIAYHKIIEVLSKSQEVELAESLMKEFKESNLKPLMPSFIDLMNMFYSLNLHDKLKSVFFECLENCKPNRTIYNIYLNSLVENGEIEDAEKIFNEMVTNEAIGVNTRSCNTILRGFLSSEDNLKAEKIYDLMCKKKYEIEPLLMDKIDYILSLSRKVVKKPISLKLSKEQREALVGLLLGGLQMESDEGRKNHVIRFDFNSKSCGTHSLKLHLYDQFHEWLHPSSKSSNDEIDSIPDNFYTISHTYFGFYADQFFPKGKPMIPKLIHRWLSPCALAYWYMYGGHRASSGDILLKLKGNPEGVENVVKTLRGKSLDCKVKRKGRVFWIGFSGSNATWFWKLIEPYVLNEFKVILDEQNLEKENKMVENPDINFESGSGSESDDGSD